jgi:uracil-DNA glycosylase
MSYTLDSPRGCPLSNPPIGENSITPLGEDEMASIHVFRGDTDFPKDRRQAIRNLLDTESAKLAAPELVIMVGHFSHKFNLTLSSVTDSTIVWELVAHFPGPSKHAS